MREPPDPVATSALGELASVAEEPWRYDFYAALRRIEARNPRRPRLGDARRPADEPVRLGQSPELSFAPAPLASVAPRTGHRPPRLDVRFFGLFGPNGPLPLHLTAYARERLLHHGDATFARFADMFHHRLLLVFYKVWARAQPTVSADRPDQDRFANLVGALIGIGEPAQAHADAAADSIKRFFAGHAANAVKSADGLASILSGWLRLPVEVTPFVGTWLALPPMERTRMGAGPRCEVACVGRGAVLGATVWDRQHHFGLRIGPVRLSTFESLLPCGDALPVLAALTLFHVGHELGWTLELELEKQDVPPCRPGRYGQLGWTTWVGSSPHSRNASVTLHPPRPRSKETLHG
jgi:type VI secretion system protein ImpH